MLLEPGTQAFDRFLTDQLGEGYEAWEKEDLLLNQQTCECCARTFTSRYDFDLDLSEKVGVQICYECGADGSADDYMGTDGF